MDIRDLIASDLIELKRIYKEAFAGFPWYESLTEAEIEHRFSYYPFDGLVATHNDLVVGAIWWDVLTIEQLKQARGEEMAKFAQTFSYEYLMWEREVMVSPQHQGQGIGLAIRQEFLKRVRVRHKSVLILTRMRDDNLPIIKIAECCGFLRTGIKTPSSQVPGLNHEYWYKDVKE